MKTEETLAAETVALLSGAVPCPTCVRFPGECCRCHGQVGATFRAPVPDPVEELRAGLEKGQGQLHLFCAGCTRSLARDVSALVLDRRARQRARQRADGPGWVPEEYDTVAADLIAAGSGEAFDRLRREELP